MNITLINPNTTASMTEKAVVAARGVAAAGTVITGTQPSVGPESIEGYYDEVFSVPGLIGCIQANGDADAYVLACFDDTGLDAARCATSKPVVGIGEAAYHLASLVANRFGVVTTLSRSVPALEHNLMKYGLAARCSGVRASDIAVLDLETDPTAVATLSAQIDRCMQEDNAEAIVLGCAGMTDLAKTLQQTHGVPVIDGVVAAVKLVESLHAMGIQTSKVGGYAAPRAKRYSGYLSSFAPTS
jgi:allantoin racemase